MPGLRLPRLFLRGDRVSRDSGVFFALFRGRHDATFPERAETQLSATPPTATWFIRVISKRNLNSIKNEKHTSYHCWSRARRLGGDRIRGNHIRLCSEGRKLPFPRVMRLSVLR